jgi:hypothetical protein
MVHHKTREEGLFTRLGATRVLCVIALFGSIAAVSGAILIAYFVFSGRSEGFSFTPAILGVYVSGLAAWVVTGALYWWRRCDRCQKRLFAENASLIGAPPPSGLSPLGRNWLTRLSAQLPRDYRAKPLLGSYRRAIVFRLALTGSLRCQWCGHEDGTKPDYVAKAA